MNIPAENAENVITNVKLATNTPKIVISVLVTD